MDELKKVLPILTLVLISGNFVKLNTFYNHFGINILNYMSSPELILSFLDDLFYYVYFIVLALIWFIIDDIFLKNKDEITQIEKQEKRVSFFYNLVWLFIGVYCLMGICSYFFLNHIVYTMSFFVVIAIHIIVSIKSSRTDKMLKYFALIPTIILLSYIDGNYLISKIEENVSDNKIEYCKLHLNDGTLIDTNKNIIFLGQTNDNIFIYNKRDKKTTILKESNISLIEVNLH